MKGFTIGMAAGMVAGAAVTCAALPKKKRNSVRRTAEKTLHAVTSVASGLKDIFE